MALSTILRGLQSEDTFLHLEMAMVNAQKQNEAMEQMAASGGEVVL